MVDELTSPVSLTEENELEQSLRPTTLDEFVGQQQLKSELRVYIDAAKKRSDALDHVLLWGPPGLGKTTLANIIANELGVSLRLTSGPAVEKKGELTGLLTDIEQRGVFFIDEIHRLNPMIEEILYPAMEDFEFDIIIGKGPGARSVKITLNRFTLVGATTRSGMLTAPLRERFGIPLKLEFYSEEDMTRIVRRSASILGVEIDNDGARELAARSRGTPRVANRLLRRTKDFAEIRGTGVISADIVRFAMERMNIDDQGFTREIRNYMLKILEDYEGGPVGLKTLATAVGETADTIEDVYEPILIQRGFIKRTPSGRKATLKAFDYFGIKRTPAQGDLFEGDP